MVDESTALAPRGLDRLPALAPVAAPLPDIDGLMRVAEVLARSGYFADTRDAAQAFAKILAGAELGIGPFQAMAGIHIIEGKPVLGSGLMASLIQRSGCYHYRIRRLDASGCELEAYEGGELLGTATFGEADAKRAGLLGKQNYQKWGEDMYFARALSRLARRFFPGVFGGPVYAPGEIEAELIDRRPIPETTRALQRPESAPSYAAATIVPETEEARRERAVLILRAKLAEVTERYLWDRDDLDLARWQDYDFSVGTAEEIMEDAEALEVVLQIARRDQNREQGAAAAESPVCEVCGKALTKGQATVSKSAYNRWLCLAHQKQAREAARG